MPGLRDATLVPASPALWHPFFQCHYLSSLMSFYSLSLHLVKITWGDWSTFQVLQCYATVFLNCRPLLLESHPINKECSLLCCFPPNTFCPSLWIKRGRDFMSQWVKGFPEPTFLFTWTSDFGFWTNVSHLFHMHFFFLILELLE